MAGQLTTLMARQMTTLIRVCWSEMLSGGMTALMPDPMTTSMTGQMVIDVVG